MRMDIGGINFAAVGGQLSVTIEVDAATPLVAVGNVADQMFSDSTAGAGFFGYYLTLGVHSDRQPAPRVVNVKVARGPGETAGRSFYLIGNGTTNPTSESDLTQATAGYTTFASFPRNVNRCGPNYAAVGIGGGWLTCNAASIDANLDITQFVKVAFTDPATPIVSELVFIAVAE